MRKEKRSVFTQCAVGAMALLLVCFMLLLLPQVQLSILSFVDRQFATGSVQAKALHLGPWGADIEGLSLVFPGYSLQASEVTVDIAMWSSLFKRRLIVEDVNAESMQLSITSWSTDRSDPVGDQSLTTEPFAGVASLLHWPKRVLIRQLKATGRLTIGSSALQLERERSLSVMWSLMATDLKADGDAALRVSAALESRQASGQMTGVNLQLVGHSVLDAEGALAQLDANLKLSPHRSDQGDGDLSITLAMTLTEHQETAVAHVTSARGEQVAAVEAHYKPDSAEGELSWELDIGPGLIATTLGVDALAELVGTSHGHARLNVAHRRMMIDGAVAAQGHSWAWLDSRLHHVGIQRFTAEIAAEGWGALWDVSGLHSEWRVAQGRKVLDLKLLQPVAMDLANKQIMAERWGQPLLHLEADQLPLAWLRDFDPQQIFDSGFLDAKLVVVAEDKRRIALHAEEPISLSSVRLHQRGGRALPVLSLTLAPRIQFLDGAISALVEDLLLTLDTGLELRFRGQAHTSVVQWPVLELIGGVALRAPGLQRRVPQLDAVRGKAEMKLDLFNLRLQLMQLALDAKATDGKRLAALLLEGDAPLAISLTTHAIDWDDFEPQRMVLRFMGAPIAWLSAYLPDIELAGGAVFGELEAVVSKETGFSLRAKEPFSVRGIVPIYRGNRVARALSLALEPRVELNNRGGKMALDNIRLSSRRKDRIGADLALEWATNPPQQLELNLAVDGYLPSLTAGLGEWGELRWRQRGMIDLATRRLEVGQLHVDIDDIGGSRVMAVRSLKPFFIENDSLAFAVRSGSQRVLKVTLTPLPLQSLLPNLLGLDIEGVLDQGEFFGRVDSQGRLVLTAPEPLVFSDVNLKWEEASLFEQLQIDLSYEVAYSVNGLEAKAISIEAKDESGDELASVMMTAVAPLTQRRPIQSLGLQLDVELAALSRQPLMRGVESLETGELSAGVSLEHHIGRELNGELSVRQARSVKYGRLPDVSAALSLNAAPGSALLVRIPMTLRSDHGRSDLTANGELSALGGRHRFEVLLAGQQIIVPDVLAFYRLLGDPSAEQNTVGAAPRGRPARSALQQLRERRDTAPFWGERLFGHAEINVAHLQLADHRVSDVRAQAQMLRQQLSLYGIHARLLGGRLHSNGHLKYDADRLEPYQLSYRMRAQGLQLGDLLQPLTPQQKPVAEGLITLSSNVSSRGRNPLDLALSTRGRIALDGRNGVFRGLTDKGETMSNAAKVVGMLTFSRQLRAIGRLVDNLNEIPFSGIRLSLVRDGPNRLQLEEAKLTSPLLTLRGSGEITAKRGTAIIQSGLRARLGVATRGDMSILFDGMGLLKEGQGRLGYRDMYRDLRVTGTLAEPDFSDFWLLLDEAATNARGSFGLGLRAINRKLTRSGAQ